MTWCLFLLISPSSPEFVHDNQAEREVNYIITIRSCWQLHQLVVHQYPLMEEEEQEEDKFQICVCVRERLRYIEERDVRDWNCCLSYNFDICPVHLCTMSVARISLGAGGDRVRRGADGCTEKKIWWTTTPYIRWGSTRQYVSAFAEIATQKYSPTVIAISSLLLYQLLLENAKKITTCRVI